MQKINRIRANYAESFRCIGSACEETCCQGWNVPIDQATYEKYQNLPAGELGALVQASVSINPPQEGVPPSAGGVGAGFARIQMTADNQCPLLSENHLCRIQTECGEGFLSYACATYPRIVRNINGAEEKALTLSCPEAARLVLLAPDLLGSRAAVHATADPDYRSPAPASDDSSHPGRDTAAEPSNPSSYFWPIREAVFALVLNRAYPLWQRLFLLGVLCRRLDSIAKNELQRSVPDFLRDFEVTIASGALRPAMEDLPIDRPGQLDVVLRLAGLLLQRSSVRPRFADCIQAFTSGIGNGPGATLESLTGHYTLAHDRYYAPFFDRSPHILENYLVNTIVRCQFPFGREGMQPGGAYSMTREFALLTLQFALMKGLLIGVAGFHREAFSTAHVVHTVQAAAKHFEHHPEFLNLAHGLLVESQMDGARGLAILLRNAAVKGSGTGSHAIHAPFSTTEAFSKSR